MWVVKTSELPHQYYAGAGPNYSVHMNRYLKMACRWMDKSAAEYTPVTLVAAS